MRQVFHCAGFDRCAGKGRKALLCGILEVFSDIKEDACIVTHGGVIAALMEHLFPKENKNRYEWQSKNGCGYIIANGSYTQLD